jgi:hypothetical protein
MRKLRKVSGYLLSKRRFHWKGHDEKVEMPEEDPLSYVAGYRENQGHSYDEDEICDCEYRFVEPEDESDESEAFIAQEDEPDRRETFYTAAEDEPTPLEEALGCQGVSVFDSRRAIIEHDMELFGCDGEDSLSRVLEDIGTNILVAAEMAVAAESAESDGDSEDVGMVVLVKNSDAQDYGLMIEDIMSAQTIEELQEVVANYKDIPCALELAKACEERMMPRKRGLSLVS